MHRPTPSYYADAAGVARHECERMPDREDLAAFIRSTFRSVWSFEIALLMKRQPKCWTHAEIVATLRASDLIVTTGVENLTMAGLIAADAEGLFSYMPVNSATAEFMDQAERIYESRPDHVRRLIASPGTTALTAFANAFRLWED